MRRGSGEATPKLGRDQIRRWEGRSPTELADVIGQKRSSDRTNGARDVRTDPTQILVVFNWFDELKRVASAR